MTETPVASTGGFVQVWTRLPLTALTGLLGFLFGISFIFDIWQGRENLMMICAFVILGCFLASLAQAFLKTRA